MSTPSIDIRGIYKRYRFFKLEDVSLRLEPGQIMGFVGPNGAGKSTTIRILMGLVRQDAGDVRVLGWVMPKEQAEAKRDIGFVSDDMRLFDGATLGWHMSFVQSIYPSWDAAYAKTLLKRFHLQIEQPARSLSHGERIKALLLLALARRPRVLVLDEPTTGMDPVARHEALAEFMEVLKDDERSILFSSHNTVDVEQISDHITFIDRGRIVDSSDKEMFLDRWRRLTLDLREGVELNPSPGVVDLEISAHAAIVTTNAYSADLEAGFERAGAHVRDVRRMTLEEIFVASVLHSRKERGE